MPGDSHLFPDTDWLIGNHSDELTPWIPVIAARYLRRDGSGREGIKNQNNYLCVLGENSHLQPHLLSLQDVLVLMTVDYVYEMFPFLWRSTDAVFTFS